MRDDDNSNTIFSDYILGKKLRLLHYLYEKLYSFALFNRCIEDSRFAFSLQDEVDNSMLWIRGTERLSIDNQLKAHSLLYKKMKLRVNVPIGSNGQQLLFEDLDDIK